MQYRKQHDMGIPAGMNLMNGGIPILTITFKTQHPNINIHMSATLAFSPPVYFFLAIICFLIYTKHYYSGLYVGMKCVYFHIGEGVPFP